MLKNKKVLIGVTGCIGAYKACSFVNKLKKEGALVKVIMTDAATKFIHPNTFQTLSNSQVYLDLFDTINKTKVEHIELADWGDVVLILPATANTISKIACGIADNLLSTVVLALEQKTPVIIVPAMNCHMWENVIIQENIYRLKSIMSSGKSKFTIVEPRFGKLACGYEGKGAVAENDTILKTLIDVLNGNRQKGKQSK